MFRDGLKCLICKQPDLELVGEAGDGRTVISLTRKSRPDVVIMDIIMPRLNGIDATRRIMQQNSRIKVLALSMHTERKIIAAMLRAGASGYVLKDKSFKDLIRAIETINSGHTFLSAGLTKMFTDDYMREISKSGDDDNLLSPLTTREREILQLIAEGKSTKEIARELYISVKTVGTHREHIMNKLKIYNVVDLAKYAVQIGLTSFEL